MVLFLELVGEADLFPWWRGFERVLRHIDQDACQQRGIDDDGARFALNFKTKSVYQLRLGLYIKLRRNVGKALVFACPVDSVSLPMSVCRA